jgi:hypothetical protein
MISRPAAHYLMRFGDEVVAAQQVEESAVFAPIGVVWPPEQEETAEDRQAEIDAARESGRAEGDAAAREECAAELEKERQAHRQELADARQKWADEESLALKSALAVGLAEIEEQLAQAVGRVLSHFAIDALRNQMMGELVETLNVLIGSTEAIAIKIEGPADLLASLRGALGETRDNITYDVTESVDVSVRAERTVIETQLSAWIAAIKAEMELPA